jgi:RNA polymerase sigma factor (sigma-70 family)
MNPDSTRTDSLPTRVSLLGRLANLSDDRSWQEFYLTYETHIRKVAQRDGLSEQDAEEVAHDVLQRVARTIASYTRVPHRGAFRSWLFQLTHWRATDQLRRRRRENLAMGTGCDPGFSAAVAADPATVAAPGGLEQKFELEAQRQVVQLLLNRLERSVSRKNIQIFEMLMLDEAPPATVARLFHTRPSAVYLVKHRVLEKLRAEVASMGPLME